jgi:tetratricopeptide (TPR) repeat protein
MTTALLLAALLAAPSAAVMPAPAAPGTLPDLYRQSYGAETRGDYAGALELMDRLGAAGGSYVAQLRRGWLLYLAGRHAQAASAYQKAAVLEPAAVEPRLGAMLPLMALRRWKDAQKLGEEVLRLAPADFTAVSRLAWIHFSQLQYAEAEPLYRRAVAAWPASAEMRTGLGWTLLKLGRHREAREVFEAVLAFAPDQLSAREGLGQVPEGPPT